MESQLFVVQVFFLGSFVKMSRFMGVGLLSIARASKLWRHEIIDCLRWLVTVSIFAHKLNYERGFAQLNLARLLNPFR